MIKHPLQVNIPARRLMMFADGENLVRRYESMLADGRRPREDIVHHPGDLVWHSSFLQQAQSAHGVVLRATYYTSVVGDDAKQEALRNAIRNLTFETSPAISGIWPNRLYPEVFKRNRGDMRSKAVDIKLVTDVLTQIWNDNVDSVLLLGGDGDYVPLVEEVLRAGKLLFLASFSSGLSPKLSRMASDVYLLESTAFAR